MELRPEVQSARAADPDRFEGRDAFDDKRRRMVSESGEIDFRRFLLSSDLEIRKKLHDLRDAVESLHERFPEMIGCTFFGSQTKGYAQKRSDIDAYLLVDEDTVSDKIRTQAHDLSINQELMKERRLDELHEEIVKSLHKIGLNLGLGSGIGIRSISWKKIEQFCQGDILDENNLAVMHLFHMGVGDNIYPRREQIISTLENMGDAGERLWTILMEKLFEWENKFFDETLKKKRRELYPKTLSEGREYFLRNAPR